MNRKWFTMLAITSLLLGGVAVFKVNAAATAKGSPRGQVLQRVVSELELTPEQIGKIKTELRSEKEAIVALLSRLHESKKTLRETIQAGTDEKAIRAAAAKVAEVDADIAVQRAKVRAKLAPILTAEQIEKVKQFEEKADEFVINAIKSIGQRLDQK